MMKRRKKKITANGHALPQVPNGRIHNASARATAARAKVPLNSRRIVGNAITSRRGFISQLTDDRRDLNAECGYPDTDALIGLRGFGSESILKDLYDRNPVAARVVEVFCEEAWKTQPTIYEDDTTDEATTCFELAWKQVASGLGGANWYKDEKYNPIWEYLHRVDVLSGIGQYGLLVIGCDDGEDMSTPAFDPKEALADADGETTTTDQEESKGEEFNADTEGFTNNWGGGAPAPEPPKPKPAKTKPKMADDLATKEDDEEQIVKTKRKLTFLRAFDQNQVQIAEFDKDPKSPRNGQPVLYNVTLVDKNDVQALGMQNSATVRIHWTRVLHVVDNARSNDVFGVPRMRPVLNRLLDIEKVTAASGEMYWYGAFPGLAANAIPALGGDVTLDMDQITEQMEGYAQGLQRFLAMSGMTVSMLSPTVSDPTPQVMLYIQAICIKLGVPQRIFMGSERGELSSGQDADTWNDRLARRQSMYLIPRLVVPLINRFILMEILPTPKKFSVWWPKPQLAPQDLAALGAQKTQALAAYVSGQCNSAISLQDYLVEFLGFDEDTAIAMIERAAADIQEEDATLTEDPLKMDAQYTAEADAEQAQMQADAMAEAGVAQQDNALAMQDKKVEGQSQLIKEKAKIAPTGNAFDSDEQREAFFGHMKAGGGSAPKEYTTQEDEDEARKTGKSLYREPKLRDVEVKIPESLAHPMEKALYELQERGNGRNQTSMLALREKTGLTREDFDKQLRELRLAGKLTADSFQGDSVALGKAHREATITEGKDRDRSILAWVSFKNKPTNNEAEIYGLDLIPQDENLDDVDSEDVKGLELIGNLGAPLKCLHCGTEMEIDPDSNKCNHCGKLVESPTVHGGPGSGNFGHAGRPGDRGGSSSGGGSAVEDSPSKRGNDLIKELAAKRELTAIKREPRTPVPKGQTIAKANVERDSDKDGVTDSSRVGVGGKEVPPPGLRALPNLTPDERAVEQAFMKAFNDDPQGMADAFRAEVIKAGNPPTFGTDDAKALSKVWSGDNLSPEERSENRSIYNLALHQTANAVAKRALIDHLDTLQPGDQILVTVGGCGAGKGYALGSDKKTGEPFVPQAAALKGESKAVWDSAGDQNATENPWILEEAEKRGLKVAYAYVHADPETQWADPDRGVVKRAQDPKDGRMVDSRVFADSYALGAKNHQAFYEANKDNPNAKFVFVENGDPPKSLNGIPEKALNIDRKALATFADKTVLETQGVPPRVRRGATVGVRVWGDK